MRFGFATGIAFVYTFLSVASAATYNVAVGQKDEFDYEPHYLNGVKSGDTIRFTFVSRIPHSVTQSTFAKPCTSKAGGLDSGVLSNTSSSPVWTTTITNATASLWFYCTVGVHCSKSGMVFAINPSSSQAFDAFQAKAVGGSTNTSSSGAVSSTSRTMTTSYTSSDIVTSTSTSDSPSATPSADLTSGDINMSAPKTAALVVALLSAGLSILM